MLHLKCIQLYKLILYFYTVQSSPKYNDYLIYGLGLNKTANRKTDLHRDWREGGACVTIGLKKLW